MTALLKSLCCPLEDLCLCSSEGMLVFEDSGFYRAIVTAKRPLYMFYTNTVRLRGGAGTQGISGVVLLWKIRKAGGRHETGLDACTCDICLHGTPHLLLCLFCDVRQALITGEGRRHWHWGFLCSCRDCTLIEPVSKVARLRAHWRGIAPATVSCCPLHCRAGSLGSSIGSIAAIAASWGS